MKLLGISLTLVLSALIAEIGEATQTASTSAVWPADRQSSLSSFEDGSALSYEEHSWGTYLAGIGVGAKQDAKQTEADQLLDESLSLWRVSRWQEALQKLEQALILYREIGDRHGEGRTLTGLGAITDNLGQYPQALEYYEQALVIRQEIGDRSGEGVTLNNIGLNYKKIGQY